MRLRGASAHPHMGSAHRLPPTPRGSRLPQTSDPREHERAGSCSAFYGLTLEVTLLHLHSTSQVAQVGPAQSGRGTTKDMNTGM